MKYISTRGGMAPADFGTAVMIGMARDGGLILPESIPDVRDRLSDWSGLCYLDLAFEIMRLYTDVPDEALRSIIARSYASFRDPEIAPVREVGRIHVLELFHGPTLAFKDIALQFLGNVFDHILSISDRDLNILAATSGDTGSAAIHGVRGRDRIRIFVMHPHNKISQSQEQQMTSVLDENVFNIAVKGTFDDCQGIMKAIFNDLEFRDLCSLGSVNSINWARLLAQIVYYFYAAFRVMQRTGSSQVRFSVPTGNFGDIFAGYIAFRMGLPIGKLILATNENDVLSRFFSSGVYKPAPVCATISPSMDIQVASNFERYLYYGLGGDAEKVKGLMGTLVTTGSISLDGVTDAAAPSLISAGVGNTKDTLATIRKYHEQHDYLLDPHTAVGVLVGEGYVTDEVPLICLATAHPAKFSKAIADAIGADVATHPIIDGLKGLPTRCDVLPPCAATVRDYIEARTVGADA